MMWRVSADTGGTFTDCYAVTPDGRELRCKVLSTGCLRARIERIVRNAADGVDEKNGTNRTHASYDSHSSDAVQISASWEVPDGFFTGCRAALVGAAEDTQLIAGWKGESHALEFASVPPSTWVPGALIEITSGEEAPILGARLLTGTPLGAPFPPIQFRLATTRATNALLERKGSRVAFFVTRGFGHLLAIGDQRRADLFALRHEPRAVFYESVCEVDERMNSKGAVLTALDEQAVRVVAEAIFKQGIRHAAVALLHSYANADHEQRIAAILRTAGFEHITLSSDIAAFTKILPRAQSAVANAYLTGPVEAFLDGVAAPLGALPVSDDDSPTRPLTPALSQGEREHESADALHQEQTSQDSSGSSSGSLSPGASEAPRSERARVRGASSVSSPASEPHLHPQRHSSFHILTSSGGLTSRSDIKPKDLLLSGPAGGVIGAANAAREMGFTKIITFDMGGTSTDVARIDGRPAYRFSQQIAGMSLLAPCVAIETVAAGGGSICKWTPSGLAVGPDSAGSSPGPACYGKGGPLTITDVNLLLGRFDPAKAPIPLDTGAAQTRLDELRARIKAARGDEIEADGLLHSFLQLAIERMADAIRRISVAEGYDPAAHALLAFGGAGPQHACALATRLGIKTVLVPKHAGILSAVGLHQALPECFAEKQILQSIDEALPALASVIASLAADARAALLQQGVSAEECDEPRTLAEMRLRGQDTPLQIQITDPAQLRHDYRAAYQRLFGYPPPESRVIEIVSLRVSVRARDGFVGVPPSGGQEGARITEGRVSDSATLPDRLKAELQQASSGSSAITGPAIIQDAFSTLIIDPGWCAHEIDTFGWRLDRAPIAHHSIIHHPEPQTALSRDLFRHRLHAIVEEMGALLCRTAISTNIRERLDFSCALLDPNGFLITSAPHIPVHLGALGVCVRKSMEHGAWGMEPGDTFITNHPAYGGSHLPDITLITPVFDAERRLLGFVANRAHHAEIGGITPGSMPANATRLIEEGTVIRPQHLIKAGASCFDEIEKLFTTGPHPTRNLADNLADLHAQLAANLLGAERLRALAENDRQDTKDGNDTRAMMRAILADSARVMRQQIASIDDCEAEEHLDDGSIIRVKLQRSTVVPPVCVSGVSPEAVARAGETRPTHTAATPVLPDAPSTIHHLPSTLDPPEHGTRAPEQTLRIDFTGTSPTHPGNLNATTAIVQSAVLYVLRLLLQQDLPLNEGLMQPIELVLPPSMLNPAFSGDAARDPAVVGGNVEVSQRLVDTLVKALRLQACSQGTMNNLLFGNERFGYYETIAGGSGAGCGYDGASALHTHMTNTAITDPEIIEQRYPVLLREFSIRRRSGGQGKWRGGDGVVREFEFLAPLTVSLLTQHRTTGPFGIDGGGAGLPGLQTLIHADGQLTILPSSVSIDAAPGDRLRIETPGGGGSAVNETLTGLAE